MKKVVVSAFAAAAMLGASVMPAFADVLRTGDTGQPYASVSDTGSAQGQANRSDTGTYNKYTHDGARFIIRPG